MCASCHPHRRKLLSLFLVGLFCLCHAIFAQSGYAGAPPHCTLPLKQPGWFELAEKTADRTTLRKELRKIGYRMPHPTRTYILVTRVIPGVGQPAYQHYSLEDTGFMNSRRKYWAASTVKVWSAVGALITLREWGLTGHTPLSFRDGLGLFRGTAADLYGEIVNEKYDRLMRIAGLDRFHHPDRRKRYGFPQMVLSRSYSRVGSLRYSPPITYEKNGITRTIPARHHTIRFPQCPSNCITFFELQEVLRRLVLHEELPPHERFPILRRDVEGLKKMLLETPNKIGRAARKLWGKGVLSYNKSGSARGLDQLENVFLVAGQIRYIVTVSVPWYRPDASATPSLLILNHLGYNVLSVMERLSRQVVSVQPDAGEPLHVRITPLGLQHRVVQMDVSAKRIDTLHVWHRRRKLLVNQPKRGWFRLQLRMAKAGRHILVMRGERAGKGVAFRSIAVDVPDPAEPWTCATAP